MRILFHFTLCLYSVNAEITKIFVIWRHGDRAPESLPYPKDPYNESYWPRGWDQLTNEGIRQTFELGRWLRRRYVLGEKPLLSRHFDRKQIFFRTSYADRAIESAQSVAAGLFPAEEHSIWHNDSHVGWQPLPIFSATRGKIDPLLRPSGVDCPVAKGIIFESESPIGKQVEEDYAPLLSLLSNWTGMQVNFKNVKRLYGIQMEMFHSLSPPAWIHETWNDTKVIDHIRELKRITRLIKFNSREKSKLKAGVLLNDWAQHLERKDRLKALLYSSHDGTLNSLMYTLGIENNLLVPYAAALILEVHSEGEQEYVQIIYKNETNRAYQLSIPGCSPVCPIEIFLENISNFRIPDVTTLLKLCNSISTIPHVISFFSAIIIFNKYL